LRRLAIDEAEKVLVWTGETHPDGHAAAAPLQAPDLPEAATDTSLLPPERAPSSRETELAVSSSEASSMARALTPAEKDRAPEAERRQLTVMFCDVADSTTLAQQLDPEDQREVMRAYQGTAAAAIHQFDGTIAQYLGDGLLVYFGWPMAHEDDASRAVHAGLGIVDAMTTTLNRRLARQHGVQIAICIAASTPARWWSGKWVAAVAMSIWPPARRSTLPPGSKV
jgi:class 3 adenylate cyclase